MTRDGVLAATPEVMGPALIYLARQTAETMTGQWRNTTDYGVNWP